VVEGGFGDAKAYHLILFLADVDIVLDPYKEAGLRQN
jgi:hypothetical protein